jgi:DNA-binding NarL/FixJ family response regulator
VLSDQGILAAVQSRITRLPIGVRLTAGPELAGARYPDEIEGAAYFLVGEGLVNVLKHARASQVQVTLSDDGPRLRVEITDDGAGFVPADAAGSGLTGLTDRMEAVGGSLSIRSRPGAGTRLAGELPVRVPDAPLRVVIAEDNYLVREGTRKLLEDGGGIDVVAAVVAAEELLDAVRRLRSGVVITDIRMPPGHHMEGIAAAQAIRAGYPGTGVVVLSQHADDAYAFELFKDGTAGLAYLLKDRVGDLDELRGALTAVASGGSFHRPGRRGSAGLQPHPPRRLSPALAHPARTRRPARDGPRTGQPRHRRRPGALRVRRRKHVSSIFAKLGLGPEPAQDRRVTAVLTFLRDSPQPRR